MSSDSSLRIRNAIRTSIPIVLALGASASLIAALAIKTRSAQKPPPKSSIKNTANLVVNYHLTRQCNYACKFCFHTAKTSHRASLEDAKLAMRLLRDQGMTRVNFSGGEPFLEPKFLGQLVQYCKQELQISTSIVSNGSMTKESWFDRYGEFLDVIAISCDSFEPETLKAIGREHLISKKDSRSHLDQMNHIKGLAYRFNVKFKINSVITSVNHMEDMTEQILMLQPCRWKIFQCLLIDGENAGPEAIRQAGSLTIDDNLFEEFVARHSAIPSHVLTPENNDTMRNSYLILDEHLRFLNNSTGQKVPGICVLENPKLALATAGFDLESFVGRDGEWMNDVGKTVFDIEDLC